MSTNVEIMKTKAERAFADRFAAVSAALPARVMQPASREAAMAAFDKLGLPHRRIEAWKYTDLRNALGGVGEPAIGADAPVSRDALESALGPLAAIDADRAVFVNGVLDASLSTLPALEGVVVGNIAGDADYDDAIASEAVVALNKAFVTDGLSVTVESGVTVEKPLMIVSVRAGGDDLLVTTRHDISLGDNAALTLIETAVSIGGTLGQANNVMTVSVGHGARLEQLKIGAREEITDLATWRIHLGAECAYRAFQFIPGAPLARNQVFVTFEGEGSELDFASAVLGNGGDHIDSTIVVDHRAPGCTSRELFKGVLDGHARGVCQGKVIVQREAQKTDGKQMAQALLLSENCEFDSKPELEIYADDVACGHGSTSAEVDPELVFYCRSRGIPKDVAIVLLTESFVAEAIEKITDERIREIVTGMAREWLAANHAE